ncbi:SPFH domain / band 7 family domain-containing protein [Ditylenchus destructor]|nr:SPFH domain / band 7 family domain-containing protein [Ditylenchus destructor]
MKEYIYSFYVIGINYLLIGFTLAELDSLELDLPAYEPLKNAGVNKNFLRGVDQGYDGDMGEMDTGEYDGSEMSLFGRGVGQKRNFGGKLDDYGSANWDVDRAPEERNPDEDDSSLLDIPDSEGDGPDNSDDNENEGAEETPWYLADENEPTVNDDEFTPFDMEDEERDKRHATGANGAVVVQEEVVESESDSEHEEEVDEDGPPNQMDLGSPLVDESGNEFQPGGGFDRPSLEAEPPRNSNIKETASSQNCSNNTQRSHKVAGNINRDEEANIQSEFGVCGWILTILSYILIFLTLPISACMVIKVVQEFERAVIFRLGRLMPGGAKGPGIFFVIPCIDTYRKVDLRVLSFEVPPQEILSKDSVTVAVDAVVYFRISNATISVTNVEDSSRSTKLLAQTTLRNILGTKTLAEMLSDREAISLQMQATLDEATEPWGVKVERVEVKDVRLPVQLQRAMAAEAEAAREARAKVIVAEGEQKASRALKEASDVIAQSPQALQLRYLQTLSSISAEKNSTIIFPFPIDLLSSFLPSRQTQKPNTSEATKPHYS